MSNGWDESAAAWIADQSNGGDYAREFILDPPMMERIRARGFQAALDIGCGEGRFCRLLQSCGVRTIGVDPTVTLIEHARLLDPNGDYRLGQAEALEFPDVSFDLVVSYLTLIDIDDLAAAIAEMARVLRPGGALLVANLNSFSTAAVGAGWEPDADGETRYCIDNYLEERAEWIAWRGVRVVNWHRPLSRYVSLLLSQGLVLAISTNRHPAAAIPTRPPATGASPTSC